jgi:hypothetical protein
MLQVLEIQSSSLARIALHILLLQNVIKIKLLQVFSPSLMPLKSIIEALEIAIETGIQKKRKMLHWRKLTGSRAGMVAHFTG